MASRPSSFKQDKSTKPKPRKHFKRGGSVTSREKELVAQFVMDQPAEVTPTQERALARVLRRSPAVIKTLVAEARENFVAGAGRYVEVHMQATEQALANGDPKSLEVAARSAQWALTNISAEGERIVEKPEASGGGPRVMVGIKFGGANTEQVTVDEAKE